MYLRIAHLIVNTSQLVHARVVKEDRERVVILTMNAGPGIELVGENAEEFLSALPVYEPTDEREE